MLKLEKMYLIVPKLMKDGEMVGLMDHVDRFYLVIVVYLSYIVIIYHSN